MRCSTSRCLSSSSPASWVRSLSRVRTISSWVEMLVQHLLQQPFALGGRLGRGQLTSQLGTGALGLQQL